MNPINRLTTSRALARTVRHQLATWQNAGRHCSRAAGELWQLRLPLMTMVGLTLLGVYNCKAVTLTIGQEAVPTAAMTVAFTEPAPAAALEPAAASAIALPQQPYRVQQPQPVAVDGKHQATAVPADRPQPLAQWLLCGSARALAPPLS